MMKSLCILLLAYSFILSLLIPSFEQKQKRYEKSLCTCQNLGHFDGWFQILADKKRY